MQSKELSEVKSKLGNEVKEHCELKKSKNLLKIQYSKVCELNTGLTIKIQKLMQTNYINSSEEVYYAQLHANCDVIQKK